MPECASTLRWGPEMALGHYVRLLLVFYKTSIQTDMEYRADFFTRIGASLLGLVTSAGSLSLAFQYTPSIAGWSFPQVMVLLAVYYLMDGLVEMFFGPNMREIMSQVQQGTLDFVLIKPVNSQFLATFRKLNIWRIGNVLIGIGLSVYAVKGLALEVGPAEAGSFAVALVCGLAVIYSVWLALVTLTFWFIRLDNVEQILWQAMETGRFPVDIYPRWLKMALTYVVPVVFIISVPAQALAGRLSPGGLAVAVAIAAGTVAASAAFWKLGLRHYGGASS